MTWRTKLSGLLCALAVLGLSACDQAAAIPTQATEPTATAVPTAAAISYPDFFFGADLSYVNEVEECGAVYLEDGVAKDPFELFASHGTNLVRARLWHNPDWTDYSTLPDVTETFRRARDAGMHTLLDFHYSDNWADPGRQEIPAAWVDLEDPNELAEALYQYTFDTLVELHGQGLMPDFVQVGNETNPGMLKTIVRNDWPRDAVLFNAGIKAVRDAALATGTSPRIVLHVAQPENTGWWFQEAAAHGVTDYDVIGISYYPQWSDFSISGLASQVAFLRETYGKDVMVVEAGYPWTTDAAVETASNVLTQGQRGYDMTPAGQLVFMQDLTQALMNSGANGVVYWEPAWVSTECVTRWGQGSHWENAAFFDFQNGNEVLPVMEYMTHEYFAPAQLPDGVVQSEYGEALIADATGDSLNALAELDLLSLYTRQDGEFLSLALEIAGDVAENPGPSYRIYIDVSEDANGATLDLAARPIEVADPYKPEYAIEVRVVEGSANSVADAAFFRWDGAAWQETSFTGGLALGIDGSSVFEFSLHLSQLGSPEFVNLAAVSAGRILTRTAADIAGDEPTPADSESTVGLASFARLDLIN